MQDVIIDLSAFYTSNAKLPELDSYIQKARDLAGNGNEGKGTLPILFKFYFPNFLSHNISSQRLDLF